MGGTVSAARKRREKTDYDGTAREELLRWMLAAVVRKCGGLVEVTLDDLDATRDMGVLRERTDRGYTLALGKKP